MINLMIGSGDKYPKEYKKEIRSEHGNLNAQTKSMYKVRCTLVTPKVRRPRRDS